jgi:hypothetical protein
MRCLKPWDLARTRETPDYRGPVVLNTQILNARTKGGLCPDYKQCRPGGSVVDNDDNRRTKDEKTHRESILQPRRHGYMIFGQPPTKSVSTVKTE